MSHILFLRLSGPMQSWGTSSRFSHRDTGKEPSKSGVIGLLCAAMGIDREQANTGNPVFKQLTEMKMGVRILREGILQSDYHTASSIAKADGGTKDTELSTRYYLSDADFLVALQCDDLDLLKSVHAALKRPVWQLFLGRKAFVPHLPVYVSDECADVTGDDLQTILKDDRLVQNVCGSFRPQKKKNGDKKERIVVEVDTGGTEVRHDVPLSFAERRFGMRRVATDFAEPIIGGDKDGNLSEQNSA